MNLSELAALGRRMRRAQTLYFRTRGTGELDAARRLEREFDAACAEVLDPREPTLFDRLPEGENACEG